MALDATLYKLEVSAEMMGKCILPHQRQKHPTEILPWFTPILENSNIQVK